MGLNARRWQGMGLVGELGRGFGPRFTPERRIEVVGGDDDDDIDFFFLCVDTESNVCLNDPVTKLTDGKETN